MPSKALLEAKALSFTYGGTWGLRNISFSLKSGSFLSLLGPNGSGKSTLLRILCGLTSPQSGEVWATDRPITELSLKQKALFCAVILQNETLQFPFTCEEAILMGLHPHRRRFESLKDEERKAFIHTLEVTDTIHLAQRKVSSLSGGELQRVLFARAFLQKPRILFLDEGMSDLDIGMRIHLHKLLKYMAKEENLTIVSVNHDISTAAKFSDAVLVLQNGRMHGFGTPQEILTPALLAEIFHVRAEWIAERGCFLYDNIE